jgi:acetyltransferase-like isoleucine patch superfamily enzyme
MGRWILSGVYSNPIGFAVGFVRSLIATLRLTGRLFPVRVRVAPWQKFKVSRPSKSKVEVNGIIRVSSWGGSNSVSSITIGEGAELRVLGNFDIGPGVHIILAPGAYFELGGRKSSTASGITSDSRIMVENSIVIGADCIIAWNVFISDSDWHDVTGSERTVPITIGDRVWIAHGASIMKGAHIPSGCIVGAKSLVSRGEFTENSLIAGVPATTRRTEVEWNR